MVEVEAEQECIIISDMEEAVMEEYMEEMEQMVMYQILLMRKMVQIQ